MNARQSRRVELPENSWRVRPLPGADVTLVLCTAEIGNVILFIPCQNRERNMLIIIFQFQFILCGSLRERAR